MAVAMPTAGDHAARKAVIALGVQYGGLGAEGGGNREGLREIQGQRDGTSQRDAQVDWNEKRLVEIDFEFLGGGGVHGQHHAGGPLELNAEGGRFDAVEGQEETQA